MKIGDIITMKLKAVEESELGGCEGCHFEYRGSCTQALGEKYDCTPADGENVIFVEVEEV